MEATTFSALGEPSRLQIVSLLREGPRSVGEVADALSIRQPQVSKHLAALGKAGLVVAEPVARRRIYHLEPEPFDRIRDWVDSFERLWDVRLDSLGSYLSTVTTRGATMAGTKVDDETAVLEKISELAPMQDTAKRLHEVITATVPELKPRLWYGMPGYAKTKSSPIICFFRVDDGVMSFGITEKANLTPEDGASDQMIESAWFINGLDEPTEARIADVVRRAAR